MSNNLYEEAINAAEQIKEAAESRVKQQLVEAMSPKIKKLIETSLMEEPDERGEGIDEAELEAEVEECGEGIDEIDEYGAGTSEEKLAELSNVVIDELRRSIEMISQSDLDKARAQIKAGILMGLESSSNRCERLARTLSVWGRVVPLSETVEKINQVSLLDLRKFAEGIFSGPSPALALYGPISKAPSLDKLLNRLSS